MTLSTSATDLAKEVRTSHEQLNRHREVWDEIIHAYHGRAWDATSTSGFEPQYQTHNYEYISWMLPKLIHSNPRFSLSTTRGGRQAVITRGLERGLNHWSQASRLQEPLEAIAIDALALVGGGYIEEVPNARMRLNEQQREKMEGSLRNPKSVSGESPEDSEQPHWPRLRRLVPFRWGWDMAATTEDGIRFYWHKVTEDKNSLLAKARKGSDEGGKWDVSAITAMATTQDSKELGYAHSSAPDRQQVTYYVMWVPDARIEGTEPEDDEHGVIYTLSSELKEGGQVSGEHIRAPYYFYGPAQGPYVKAGFYSVPNSTMPLAPLIASRDAAEVVGRVHKAMVKRVEKYRKGAIYDLKDKRDIERIENSRDMDLIGVTGFDGQLGQYEVGGITAQDLEHHRFLIERLQTLSGLDDSQRGNVTGSGTATEVAIASEGSQERVSFLIGKWRQFVADVAQRIAWYAAHDDKIVFSYKVDEDQREQVATEMMDAGMMDPADAEALMRYGSMTFAGGDFAKDADGSEELLFGDLDFDVEPYSMQRRDQRTRKMDTLEALNVLSQFGAAAAQGVPIDFGKIASLLADVYALPEIEDVVNRDLAQQQGILSMQERQVAMENDTIQAQSKSKPGGAKAARSERAAPPANPVGQTQKGIM